MVWGRWSISLLMGLLPPISQGLAKEVGGDRGWGPFLGASAILAISHLLMHRCPGLPRAAAAAIVMALAWSLYLKHRLGGHSGDLLGAGSQLVESAVLLALVA
jgi:adenosylcobinamide-GDP ribazoletransferase